jgi:phosphoribosylamine---glycine ligase
MGLLNGVCPEKEANKTIIWQPIPIPDSYICLKMQGYMNVLILGSGGREHALAWKLRQSPKCGHLYVIPGNGGTSSFSKILDIDAYDFNALAEAVKQHNIELIVVGPEDFLVAGIADFFEKVEGVRIVGPVKAAAMLEGSKAFAKAFMSEMGIPTADYAAFEKGQESEALAFLKQMKAPYVVKADGLAAGKGVVICPNLQEAEACVRQMFSGQFGEASSKVVLESFLDGIEFSVFVLTDGIHWKLLPAAKDYKKVGEGDQGPNTGGMGAVSPVPFLDEKLLEKVENQIINPTIKGLQNRGITYHGVIFFGLIMVDGDPFVIEYNCRFGDPETEVILPRIEGDLLSAFDLLTQGRLHEAALGEIDQSVCTVMYCSQGYPGNYAKGSPINLPLFSHPTIVFHAGTRFGQNGQLVSNGGRVLAVSSYGRNMEEALQHSYAALKKIDFPEGFYRNDIGFDLKS